MNCHHAKCWRRASYIPVIPIVSAAFLAPLFYMEQVNRPTCSKHIAGEHKVTNDDINACRQAFDAFKKKHNIHPTTKLKESALQIQFNKTRFTC